MPKKTTPKFKTEAREKHGDRYDYSQSEYDGAHTKLTIICPIIDHGPFEQTPSNHLHKTKPQGCPRCAEINRREAMTVSEEEAREVIEVLGFELEKWGGGSAKKSTYRCPEGEDHVWSTTLDSVRNGGTGCPHCHGRAPLSEKVARSRVEAVDLELLKWGGSSRAYSKFRCPEGHTWPAKYNNIVDGGRRCPKCHNFASQRENCWLDIEGIQCRQYAIPESPRRKVDGFDPKTNTVYQFHGSYYHGDPKRFHPDEINEKSKRIMGELYKETIQKDNDLVALGYNVIYIWESVFEDWYGKFFADWERGRSAKWGAWS